MTQPSTTSTILYFLSNSLSLLASITFFYLFFKTKVPSNLPLKLIFLLTLSTFIFNLTNLINPLTGLGTTSCNVIGSLKVFTGWTGLFWISLISLYSYIILGETSLLSFLRIFPWLIAVCVLIPIGIALTPLLGVDSLLYTNIDGYCGVQFTEEATTEQKFFISLTTRILPYVIAVTITIVACVREVRFFRNLPLESVTSYNMNANRLLVYPIAQLLIYTPNALAVFGLIWIKEYPEWLVILGMTCYNLGGFVNLLVYGRQVHERREVYDEVDCEDSTSSQSFVTTMSLSENLEQEMLSRQI